MLSETYTNLFLDQYSIKCPITECEVYKKGCQKKLNNKVYIGDASPWELEAKANKKNGYTKNFCIKCTGVKAKAEYELTVK